MNSSTSRREFLTGAGVLVAGAAAYNLVGCGPVKAKEEEGSSNQDIPVSWDEEYDVIVIGAGLAGTTSAVTVATEGSGATCLLLEKGKSESGGGNSQFSAGMISATNDYDSALEYFMALRGENKSVSDEICKAHVQGMTEHVSWLKGLGAGDDLVVSWETDNNDGYIPEYPELCPQQYFGRIRFGGAEDGSGYKHVQLFMSDKVSQLSDSITRKTESPVQKLIQDPTTKEILGVVYESKGNSVTAKANKGVVMCCGGFENNAEMLSNYFKAYHAHPCAGLSNTGDGFRMCNEVGAQLWHQAGIAGFNNNFASLGGTKFAANDAGAKVTHKEGIVVGAHGRRYYMEVGGYGNVNLQDKDLRTHVGHRHGDQNLGGEWMHCQLPAISWYVFDQEGFNAGATTDISKGDPVDEGWGYSSDTLEGLAQQMGVPVEELEKTVTFWNALCDGGEDMAFYRDPSTMRHIATAPFYAMKMIPNFLNTNGGPERSEKGEVLDYDKNPIPHLYAAGEFGSIWSDLYNGGGNLTECLVWGRVSARNCLGIA